MKIEIDCSYSDDQLDRAHADLSEARAQCDNVDHLASLHAAIQLIDRLRTEMKARGGFRP
jgi:hypothetical protein